MAINITDPTAKKPKKYSQAKDPVAFSLTSDLASSFGLGSEASIRINFTGGVSALNALRLYTSVSPLGYIEMVFMTAPDPDYSNQVPAYTSGSVSSWINLVGTAMRMVPYIADYYTVTIAATYLELKSREKHNRFTFTNATCTSMNVNFSDNVPGVTPNIAASYRLEFALFMRRHGSVDFVSLGKSLSFAEPNSRRFITDLSELLANFLYNGSGPFVTGMLADRAAEWYVNISEAGGVPVRTFNVQQYRQDTFIYRGGGSRINTEDFSAHVAAKKLLKPYGRTSQTVSRSAVGRYFVGIINVSSHGIIASCDYELNDGTPGNVSLGFSPGDPFQGALYQFDASPSAVAAMASVAVDDLKQYTVKPTDPGSADPVQPYSFYCRSEDYGEQFFWYESSFGVTETVSARGDTSLGVELDKDEFRMILPFFDLTEINRETFQRFNFLRWTGEVFSGYMPMDELRDFWIDLLISEHVWTHGDSGELYRVHIDPESYSLFRKDDALYGVRFTYKRTMYHQAYSVQS